MVKRCIFLSFYLPSESVDYHRHVTQMFYSLTTLYQHNTNPNFDVILFLDCPEKITQFFQTNFKQLKIINFKYDHSYSLTMPKWICASMLSDLKYEQALMIDGDVIYRGNVEFIFDKYSEKDYYGIYERFCNHYDSQLPNWSSEVDKKLLWYVPNTKKPYSTLHGFDTINTGQILFNKNAIEALKDSVTDISNYIHKVQSKLRENALHGLYGENNKMDPEPMLNLLIWMDEQYAGHQFLIKNNLTFDTFNYKDVFYTTEPRYFNLGTILHYIGICNSKEIIPDKYWTYCKNL